MFWVYVIKNINSGKIYIGQTNNIEKRLARHNNKLPTKSSSFTSKNKGTWELVYKESYKLRQQALKREKQLKSAKGREYIKNIIE